MKIRTITAVLLAAPFAARANDWIGVQPANWTIPQNWTGGIPTPGNDGTDARIDNGDTVWVDGFSAASANLTVGDSNSGTLLVENGGEQTLIHAGTGTIDPTLAGYNNAVAIDSGAILLRRRFRS